MKFIYLLTSLGTKSQSKKEDSEHQEKDVKNNVISIIDVVSEVSKGPHSNLSVRHTFMKFFLKLLPPCLSLSIAYPQYRCPKLSHFSFSTSPKPSPNLACAAYSGLVLSSHLQDLFISFLPVPFCSVQCKSFEWSQWSGWQKKDLYKSGWAGDDLNV